MDISQVSQISSESTNSNSSQESYLSSKTTTGSIRMKDLFNNILDTKIHAIQFMQRMGVIPATMLCPGPLIGNERYGNCGKPMVLKEVKDRKDNITWRCRKVHKIQTGEQIQVMKDVKVTVREGTWIKDCNLTIEEIILMLYCWSQDFSNAQIQHEVGCSDKTVTSWCYFFRRSCLAHLLDYSDRIGGPGIEVEIDESKFGKRKYYRGQHVEGQWIFGGRETLNKKKMFMMPVPDRTKKTLLPLIKRHIKKGSIIHSDCWSSYKGLKKMGYEHKTVNHSKEFKNPKTGACTNHIESEWRHAKVSLPRYGVRHGKHSTYLAEFLWRRKFSEDDKFEQIFKQLNEHHERLYFMKAP